MAAELWPWLNATMELWSSLLGCQACTFKSSEEEILVEAHDTEEMPQASDANVFRCIQCRRLSADEPLQAVVAHKPTQVRGCAHGPFCGRCAGSVRKQVLGLCVCRALVSEFRL
ncbi:unnamed protein product [Symbiodinium natans]|uniref:RING-type domain-containing protein n=1 Tax=Symbiodinium natans TaxID=878477 RepID=A0A812P415_9DINO|nr:unnamed protein product [Symbiodinium natans]